MFKLILEKAEEPKIKLSTSTGSWKEQEHSSRNTSAAVVVVVAAAAAATAKRLQSCPTLCNSIDDSPPGSAVPGFLQARSLEWVVISFSNA